MKLQLPSFIVAAFCLPFCQTDTTCPIQPATNQEHRLVKCLLQNYFKEGRPVRNHNDTVNVNFSMDIMNLVNFDERHGTVISLGWLYMAWLDPQLQWNASDFGGLKHVSIPTDKIWLPDITLISNVGADNGYLLATHASVFQNGGVHFSPYLSMRSYCIPKLDTFPYDTQKCGFTFASWIHDASSLNLSLAFRGVGLEYMSKNSEWEMLKYNRYRFEHFFPVNEENDTYEKYPLIHYNIVLRRRNSFHKHLFVFPGVCLALLTSILFLVPFESSERLSLAGLIIVSNTLLLLCLESYLPLETGEMPLIGKLYVFSIIYTTISTLLSCYTLNCYFGTFQHRPVPSLLKKIFLGKLRRVLCVHIAPYVAEEEFQSVLESVPSDSVDGAAAENSALTRGQMATLEDTLKEIKIYLRLLYRQNTGREKLLVDNIRNEWIMLGRVLDRLLFFTFLAISSIMFAMLHS